MNKEIRYANKGVTIHSNEIGNYVNKLNEVYLKIYLSEENEVYFQIRKWFRNEMTLTLYAGTWYMLVNHFIDIREMRETIVAITNYLTKGIMRLSPKQHEKVRGFLSVLYYSPGMSLSRLQEIVNRGRGRDE